MPNNSTFDSSAMRPRDQEIMKTHEREINSWRQRCEGLSKQIFDESNAANRLCKLLGFRNVAEALLYIETSTQSALYRDCLERNAESEGELRNVEESYSNHLDRLQLENQSLKRELDGRSERVKRLEAKQRLLEDKYDDLERTFKQAQAKHASDNAKFAAWKDYFWEEWDKEKDKDRKDKEMAKNWAMHYLRKRRKVAAHGEGVFDQHPSDIDLTSPVKRPHTPPSHTTPKTVPLSPTTKANFNSSPTIFVRSPFPRRNSQPSTSSPLKCEPVHSETEEESPEVLAHPDQDSVTEDETPSPPRAPINLPASPISFLKRAQARGMGAGARARDGSDLEAWFQDVQPARKRRRTESSASSRGHDIMTPVGRGEEAERECMHDEKENSLKRVLLARSASQLRMPPPSAPVASTSKNTGDYSAYKGRGRYAPAATSDPHNKILNQLYVVNAEQNGGLDYEFDEVVRGKDNRKRLKAADCDECRDYYEAIGPMPPRLQAPLWRSPVSSPVKERPRCSHQHGSRKGRADTPPSPSPHRGIDAHKQAISRHRAQWDRAETPPDYWNIGFPDTQEIEEINERAKQQQQRKLKAVEKEAMKDNGRYKRR